jgi:large subunit ribosomal protein L4
MAESTTPNTAPNGGDEAASTRVIAVKGPITVPVVNKAGQEVGTVSIDPAEFSPIDPADKARGGKISKQLMHDVVLMYLANQRAGTHHTLRRGQVAGSTKKLFRQKGTGNARVGPKRSNKRRGGGTSKGPKPRDYEYHLPKKAVKAATRMAILSKFLDKEAVILDELTLATPRTKEIAGVLKAIKVGTKTTETGEKDVTLADTTVLIGTAGLDPNVYKSARNIENVKVLPAAEFNCYTVLKQKRLVLTRAALEALRNPEAAKPAAGPKTPATPEPERVRRGRAGEIQKRKKAAKK